MADMSDRIHISAAATEQDARLPKSVLERIGLANGGEVEFVVRDNCIVLKPRDEKLDLKALADEIMDRRDAVFRALS